MRLRKQVIQVSVQETRGSRGSVTQGLEAVEAAVIRSWHRLPSCQVWTTENRSRDQHRDPGDAEWDLRLPPIPGGKRGVREHGVNVRELLNGVM